MFLFRSFFSFFLAFMKQKRLQKEKKKCRKYRHCRICQCLPLSGAAKKEYKINIAIEWRTEICYSMGPNNLWSWILNFSSNQFYNNTWSHLLSDKIPSRVDESQTKYFIFVIFNFSGWNFVCRSDGFWILLSTLSIQIVLPKTVMYFVRGCSQTKFTSSSPKMLSFCQRS